MARSRRRRADAGDYGTVWRQVKRQLAELPPLPKVRNIPTDPYEMGLPDGCAEIVDYARTDALRFLVRDRNIRGVGLGLRQVEGKETGEFAAQFVVYRKLPRRAVPRGALLPREVRWKGRRILVDVLAIPGPLTTTQLPLPQGQFPRATGQAVAGSAVANENLAGRNRCAGGTLGGTWPALSGGGQRGLTCAHVALGFGIDEFLAGLPGSILRLFDSPSGRGIVASDDVNAGQNFFRLMTIDTIWPMLVPWLLTPIAAGALAFIYVDGAAGRVRPAPTTIPFSLATPPPAPPIKRTLTGGRIGAARVAAVPGTRVYKIGQTTGITWGRVLIDFLQLALPIPIGPVVIIFDQVLSRLSIARGDSGASLLAESSNDYFGSCWAGLPLQQRPVSFRLPTGFSAPCPVTTADVLATTLSTPARWISPFMNLRMF